MNPLRIFQRLKRLLLRFVLKASIPNLSNDAFLALVNPSDDVHERMTQLKALGERLFPGYRYVWPQLDWWEDVQFNRFLDRFEETFGNNTQRRWTLWQLCQLTNNIEGNTAECGVFHGAGSYLIALRNRHNSTGGAVHFAFDSFEGLSQPGNEDGEYWKQGDMSCGLSAVKINLQEFENEIVYCQGWIPGSFANHPEHTYRFVHIDVDLYDPTICSLSYFYPRLAAGGIILCDDFGFASCPGATKACIEFFADKPENIIALADGGAFIVKQRTP